MNRLAKETGATLLEALAFLAITAIVVIAVLGLLKSSFSAANVNSHIKEIKGLQSSVSSTFRQQGSFSGVTTDVIVSMGLIPSTMSVSGTAPTRTVTNLYGGDFSLTGATSNFSIITKAIPTEDCIKLIVELNFATSVQVGAATAVTPPYPPGTAVTDCQAGTPPNDIIITQN